MSCYFPVGSACMPDISSHPEDPIRGMISHSLSTVGVVAAWHHDQGNKVTPKPHPNHSLTLTIYNLCGKVAFVRPSKDTSSVMGHINQLQLRETSQTTSRDSPKGLNLVRVFPRGECGRTKQFPAIRWFRLSLAIRPTRDVARAPGRRAVFSPLTIDMRRI